MSLLCECGFILLISCVLITRIKGPLEAEEEDNIDQDFDLMDDISDGTPESDEAFGNQVPIDDDARIDPSEPSR